MKRVPGLICGIVVLEMGLLYAFVVAQKDRFHGAGMGFLVIIAALVLVALIRIVRDGDG